MQGRSRRRAGFVAAVGVVLMVATGCGSAENGAQVSATGDAKALQAAGGAADDQPPGAGDTTTTPSTAKVETPTTRPPASTTTAPPTTVRRITTSTAGAPSTTNAPPPPRPAGLIAFVSHRTGADQNLLDERRRHRHHPADLRNPVEQSGLGRTYV